MIAARKRRLTVHAYTALHFYGRAVVICIPNKDMDGLLSWAPCHPAIFHIFSSVTFFLEHVLTFNPHNFPHADAYARNRYSWRNFDVTNSRSLISFPGKELELKLEKIGDKNPWERYAATAFFFRTFAVNLLCSLSKNKETYFCTGSPGVKHFHSKIFHT